VAATALWIWLNPRVFPGPRLTDNWASKAALGERVWPNRGRLPAPPHHRIMPHVQSAVSEASKSFVHHPRQAGSPGRSPSDHCRPIDQDGQMRILKPTAIYFALVFGTGFGLGIARVLWLVPRFGTRATELAEMPLMLVAIVLAAHGTSGYFAGGDRPASMLGVGLLAMGLVLAADLVVGVALRGMSPVEALVNRDLVSGTTYYAMLGLFAVMPWLLAHRRAAGDGTHS
jgi:hypothetical protein